MSNNPSKNPYEIHTIPVEAAQWKDGQKAPYFTRTVHAGTETFVFEREQACAAPAEITASGDFSRFAQLFASANAKELKRRGIKTHDERPNLEELDAFIESAKKIANFDLETEINAKQILQSLKIKNTQALEKILNQLVGLLKFWLGYRTRGQFTKLNLLAHEEQEKFDRAIRDFIFKIEECGKLVSDSKIIDKNISFAPTMSVIGRPRDSLKGVFRTKYGNGSFAYPPGLDFETGIKRRTGGKEIKNQFDNAGRAPGERSILDNGDKWLERRYNVGGLPIAIFYNDKYAAHLAPGLEALLNHPAIPSLEVALPAIKVYFGVDAQKMGGQERQVYTRYGELRVAISALHGKDKEDTDSKDLMDYFGHLKKTMLSMVNMWLMMLSVVASKKYLLQRNQDDKFKELMQGFPEEFRPLFGELTKLLKEKPEDFQQLLPTVEIPEIEYYPRQPGFDSGRYLFAPVHGAAYTINFADKQWNFVLPGDSGVGKSEVLRELQNRGIEVESILADDMLFLVHDRKSGKTFAVGTESGAFTKTDDITGVLNTTKQAPLVGYNANEPSGNRRVIEPCVAKPLAVKEVNGYIALVNAREYNGKGSRVEQIDVKKLTELWQQGPYQPSSSLEGGGVKAEKKEVPFWNEFGIPPFATQLKRITNRIYVDNPEDDGATPEEVQLIQETRDEILTLLVNTNHTGEQHELNRTFASAAKDLQEILQNLSAR